MKIKLRESWEKNSVVWEFPGNTDEEIHIYKTYPLIKFNKIHSLENLRNILSHKLSDQL